MPGLRSRVAFTPLRSVQTTAPNEPPHPKDPPEIYEMLKNCDAVPIASRRASWARARSM